MFSVSVCPALALTTPLFISAALIAPNPLIVCPADCVSVPLSSASLPYRFNWIVPVPDKVPPLKFKFAMAFPPSLLTRIVPLSVRLPVMFSELLLGMYTRPELVSPPKLLVPLM